MYQITPKQLKKKKKNCKVNVHITHNTQQPFALQCVATHSSVCEPSLLAFASIWSLSLNGPMATLRLCYEISHCWITSFLSFSHTVHQQHSPLLSADVCTSGIPGNARPPPSGFVLWMGEMLHGPLEIVGWRGKTAGDVLLPPKPRWGILSALGTL